MRVLVCPDRMGALSSAEAGSALATGWPGARTRTVGEAGAGFLDATADGWLAPVRTAVLDGLPLEWATTGDAAVVAVTGAGPWAAATATAVPATAVPAIAVPATVVPAAIPYEATSLPLGRAVAQVLTEGRPGRLLIDLAGLDVHDAGAGLLAGLGATASGASLVGGPAGLTGLTGVDLSSARRLLHGIELIGVVPTAQRDDQLLGLRGITSRRGRDAVEDVAALLATDATLQKLTELVAPHVAGAPGAGACGGLGWAVLALGGRLSTGPELGLAGAVGPYDLVVTGCGVFDFASRGGGVVAAAAALAADRLAPCVVIAGEVVIGSREMRTMGIEAAYPIRRSTLDVPTGGDLSREEVERAAIRVAKSWRW